MRLLSFLLFTTLVSAHAKGTAQNVTISGQDLTLKRIFTEIKHQTGHVLLSKKELTRILNTQKLSVSFRDQPLREVLELILKDLPLKYVIEGKTIILIRREITAVPEDKEVNMYSSLQLAPPVTGIVTGPDGSPLAGVSVAVKNTKNGVYTDAAGRFSIGVSEGQILVFTSVGFEAQSVKIGSSTEITLTLKRAESKLDEVQIIAYGQTSARLSTGNVSSVKAKDIERSPVSNPLLAIAGRVPGVFITQTTGYAGAGVQVQVQGRNSISNGTVPFYVIDGVPFVQSLLTPLNGIQGSSNAPVGGGPSNPLAFLNPQDIESIDVLKDADATAIYGSRAANGAILITTKKGRLGKSTVAANVQHGFGQVGKKLETLNTDQYLTMRKDAFRVQGLAVPDKTSIPTTTNYDLTYWDQTRYTDWQKVLIGGKAQYTDAQASISGGNATTQILLGANYHRETTVIPGDFYDNRGGVHFNITQASTNQRFKLSFSGNFLTDKNLLPGVELTSAAMKIAPNAPALYDSLGNLNWQLLPAGAESWSNPVAGLKRKYQINSTNLVSNVDLSYRIWHTLTLKTTIGYTRLDNDEMITSPQTAYAPSSTGNNRGVSFSDRRVSNWIVEPQLSYRLNKAFGNIDFLLGTTFQKNKYDLEAFTASGYSNDAQLENITAATQVTAINAIKETYNYNAFFGRVSYNLNDKYLINLSARRDGSSRFGSENLFNNFYGAGAAWVFTKENWMDHFSLLSFGKLKASYGTTGNDQIGNYAFMALYRTVGVPQPYGGGTTLRANSLSNPYVQWEETRKFNVGLDLGFLSDRILLNANYYINRSSNQLLGYNLPIITGFNTITENFDATVENRGLELALSSENIKGKAFTWTTSINLTVPRNELVAFPGLETSSYATSLVIGKPLSITKAFRYAGVNATTGRYNFELANKSLVEIPVISKDETIIIDRTQKFYGGFQNTVSYKGFSLDFLLQFTKQLGYDETRFGFNSPGSFSSGNSVGNQPLRVLENWKAAGDNAPYQRLNPNVSALTNVYAYASNIISDGAWTDASYVRLKNFSVSYAVPVQWLQRAHMQQLRLYVQGQNLLTFTKYKGLDPENQSSSLLPPLRVITFGVQVSL